MVEKTLNLFPLWVFLPELGLKPLELLWGQSCLEGQFSWKNTCLQNLLLNGHEATIGQCD